VAPATARPGGGATGAPFDGFTAGDAATADDTTAKISPQHNVKARSQRRPSRTDITPDHDTPDSTIAAPFLVAHITTVKSDAATLHSNTLAVVNLCGEPKRLNGKRS
jgi:hypothetical protein